MSDPVQIIAQWMPESVWDAKSDAAVMLQALHEDGWRIVRTDMACPCHENAITEEWAPEETS